MLHLRYLGILLFILFGYHIKAQCLFTAKGKVQDIHHVDEGLEFATIFIDELDRGVACDSIGQFNIANLCKGKYHFLVSHVGCETQRYFISIVSDTSLVFSLEHHTSMLDEVTVLSNQDKYGITIQQSKISGELLQSMQGKDISQIASITPGVNILKSGFNINKPIINGLSGNRILLLNQGVPQEGQMWGSDHAPEIDPFTAQSIAIVKGSASVKYGVNALGGIIVMESLPISEDPHPHFYFSQQYATNGRKIISNVRMDKASAWGKLRLMGTYKKSGDLHTPNYFLTNTGTEEYNIAALVTNSEKSKWYRSIYTSSFNTTLGILRGAHVSNLSDLQEAIKRTIPFYTNDSFSYRIDAPKQAVNHHLLKIENKYLWKENQVLNIDFSLQNNNRKEYDIRRGGRSDIPTLHLKLWNTWADAFYTRYFNESKYQIGLQHKFVNNNNAVGTGILPLLPNYVQQNFSVYGSGILDLGKWNIELGSRLEHQTIKVALAKLGSITNKSINGFNFSTNTGMQFHFTTNFYTRLNVGYTARQPLVNEMFSNGLHQGLASIEEGNENLKNEQSLKMVSDTKFKVSEHNTFQIGVFYHHFNNYIYLIPTDELRLTIRGAFPVYKYNQVDARIKGLDILIHQEVSHSFEIIGKLAYAHGSEDNGKPLIYISPFNANLELGYIFKKIISMNEIKISTNYTFTAKQNRIVPNQDFTDSPNAYQLVNVSLQGKAKWWSKELVLSISCENLFNTKYRDYLNRFRYFSDELGRNFIFKFNINI